MSLSIGEVMRERRTSMLRRIRQLHEAVVARETFLQGVAAANGMAIGNVVLVAPQSQLGVIPDQMPQAVDKEIAWFRVALALTRQQLCISRDRMSDSVASDSRDIFDVYLALLEGDDLIDDTLMRIHAGQWTPSAWRDTIADYIRVFDAIDDRYLRQRADDIRDLGQLVIAQLLPQKDLHLVWPQHTILVGDILSIVDIAAVPQGQLVGIVCRQGSPFSHVAVMARALGIPAVVGLGDLPEHEISGRTLMVDGESGRIYVDPDAAIRQSFEQQMDAVAQESARLATLRDVPAQTVDGVTLPLLANIGFESAAVDTRQSGAEGVGLYRTEFQFLLRDAFPTEEEQYQLYRALLMSFSPQPVTVRTLDVGGDKILLYFPVREENPFLGCRGIRFSLSYPDIFLVQLRALLRANVGLGNLRLMFPMIARVTELDQALVLLERACEELGVDGCTQAMPPVGVMIEVPSAVFLTRAMAARVDFFSVGTNDLAQYMLAVDRNNAKVTTPYDSFHPAVLSAIHSVVNDAHLYAKKVSVCGEMASDPVGAVLLLGLGVDELSMNPASIARVKQVIRAISYESAQALARTALLQTDGDQVHTLASATINRDRERSMACAV